MTLMQPAEADALLDVLRRRPVFRNNPQLIDAFGQLNYKRFIAPPEMAGADQMAMAKRCGGALALAFAEPPPHLMRLIAEVLEDGATFLLMCHEDKDRQEIGERVDEYLVAQKRKPAAGSDCDGQHRLVGLPGKWLG